MKNLNIQKFRDINPQQEKNNQKKLERQKVEETSATGGSVIRATDCNTEK
jgi:hypothetical protein